MLKRKEVVVSYERTVQLAQFSPIRVGVSTTLVNDGGWQISENEIAEEYKTLQDFCDTVIEEKLASITKP